MTKFVWVLGPTAVGKDTLITKIAENLDHPLVSRLQLKAPILIQQDALILRHDERGQLERKIASDHDKASTILIKWQGADMGRRTIFKLREMFPDDPFVYIFLDAIPELMKKRREKRGSPAQGYDDVNDRRVCVGMARELQKLGIDLIWFDNRGEVPVEIPGPLQQ